MGHLRPIVIRFRQWVVVEVDVELIVKFRSGMSSGSPGCGLAFRHRLPKTLTRDGAKLSPGTEHGLRSDLEAALGMTDESH